MDDPDFFVQNSGIWTGQRLNSQGEAIDTFTWNLSLTPNTPYPSAFGATNAREGKPCVLYGTWPCRALLPPGASHPTTHAVHLKELSCEELATGSSLLKYDGFLVENQGIMTITGVWAELNGSEKGHFVCMRETDDPTVHVTGIWVGEAAPGFHGVVFF
jgi:hypothetical protein